MVEGFTEIDTSSDVQFYSLSYYPLSVFLQGCPQIIFHQCDPRCQSTANNLFQHASSWVLQKTVMFALLNFLSTYISPPTSSHPVLSISCQSSMKDWLDAACQSPSSTLLSLSLNFTFSTTPLHPTTAIQDTTACIGPYMTHILTSGDHSQDPLLIQLALPDASGCVSLCIACALSSFCISFPSKSDAVLVTNMSLRKLVWDSRQYKQGFRSQGKKTPWQNTIISTVIIYYHCIRILI